MWHTKFEDRLRDWHGLRLKIADIPLDSALLTVNDWWYASPWKPYYLHWDDHKTWPDPWQLLADNTFCDLARSLGIVYTISMGLNLQMPIQIAETDLGNLVLIDQGKYILNWRPGSLLNIASTNLTILRTLDSVALHHLMGL